MIGKLQMQANLFSQLCQDLKNWVCELQKKNLSLNKQLKNKAQQHQDQLKNLYIDLINILDLIELAELNVTEDSPTQTLFLKKVKKRLLNVLATHNVISFRYNKHDKIRDDVKVVETRCIPDIQDGVVLECSRNGYKQDDAVLRYCEVITNKH